MAYAHAEAAGRAATALKDWFDCRRRECTRCVECDGPVTPWESHCTTCGQADPAKVSTTAGVLLTLGLAAAGMAGLCIAL